MHRADTLITEEERRKVKEKVRVALRNGGYLESVLKEIELVGMRQFRKDLQKEEQHCDDQSEHEGKEPSTKI